MILRVPDLDDPLSPSSARVSSNPTYGTTFTRGFESLVPLYIHKILDPSLAFWAAALKRSMTYAFTHIGDFLLLLLLLLLLRPPPQISVSRPKFQS